MYGGADAVTYFVRAIRKSNWFTLVPVQLSQFNGQLDFNRTWSAKVSRGGDYMLHNWLRVRCSAVTGALLDGQQVDVNRYLRWTHNFMHNLVKCCSMTANDIPISQFDNTFLDFWAAFTVPAGKAVGYGNMVGNIPRLVDPDGPFALAGTARGDSVLDERVHNLPLPLAHTRDHGVAWPAAAVPYNEVLINLEFRDWTELLLVSDKSLLWTNQETPNRAATINDVVAAPVLTEVAVWAHYALVSNDERKKMGKAPRDILIEQVQRMAPVTWNTPATQSTVEFPIKYSHAIKVMFFGARNTTVRNEWSNYTTRSPQPLQGGIGVVFPPEDGIDPIARASLNYENTQRLANMPIDYFSLMNPWYHAISIPGITGYHVYSYSLWFYDIMPKGSTDYSKLTNVSMLYDASADAISAANGLQADNQNPYTVQTFELVHQAVANNIIRISGGIVGYPIY